MRSYLVDSSVILEALNGNLGAREVLNGLENITGKSYLTLRGNKKELLTHRAKLPKLYRFLRENFVEVPLTEEISDLAFELMTKHALLPNDSLILATAKFYELTLVTLDSDFEGPAKAEGISLFGGETDG